MNSVYQHFRKDEFPLIDQISDMAERAESTYQLQLTHFLNPRERHIARSIIGQWSDLSVESFGGFSEAENQRLLIIPMYVDTSKEDYHIAAFEIDYPAGFTSLTHGSILGSLMGLGIRRDIIGDIITDGDTWQFFADEQMADYLMAELNHIGRHAVSIMRCDEDMIITPLDKWKKDTVIVSSLRLDSVIARALNLSRKVAKDLIQSERVKVNWATVNRPDFECDEYDMISVRKFGRIRLGSIQGMTKKDNLILTIDRIKSNDK